MDSSFSPRINQLHVGVWICLSPMCGYSVLICKKHWGRSCQRHMFVVEIIFASVAFFPSITHSRVLTTVSFWKAAQVVSASSWMLKVLSPTLLFRLSPRIFILLHKCHDMKDVLSALKISLSSVQHLNPFSACFFCIHWVMCGVCVSCHVFIL